MLGWAGAVVAALVGVLLWLDWLPRGVLEQWVWPRRELPLSLGSGSLVALLAVALAAVATFGWLRTREASGRSVASLLLLIFVIGVVVVVGMALADDGFWFSGPLALISDSSMGYYGQALQLSSARDAFCYHVQRTAQSTLPDRVRSHPPGPMVFFFSLHKLLRRAPNLLKSINTTLPVKCGYSAVQLHRAASRLTSAPLTRRDALIAVPMTFILVVLPVLIVLPAYGIGAVVFGRRAGLILALLTLTLPSLLHFVPSIEGIGAVIALSFVWLWLVALRRGQWWLYLFAAIGASVMLLWSFGYAILLVLALLVALPVWGQAYPDELSRHLRGALTAIGAFILVHLAIYLWSGYNILSAMAASLIAHRHILTEVGRTYWVWLPMNLYDFLLFMGPALVVLLIWVTRHGLRSRRWSAMPQGLIIGLIIILVALLISGSTRGEVGRIWLFLMPLAALPAADYLSRLPGRKMIWLGSALVVLQVGFAILVHATLVSVAPF